MYKELKIRWGGQQYIFVTRGRAKPFTEEEAIKYLESTQNRARDELFELLAEGTQEELNEILTEEPSVTPDVAQLKRTEHLGWHIPDDRDRKRIFRNDLKQGMDYCVKKYGQTEQVIQAEAERLAAGGF